MDLVSIRSTRITGLTNALEQVDVLVDRLGGRQPAVFLDYDGTLTPIVDRPEDAVISEEMRDAVRRLARHCTVCVVSGRDRPVVQQLLGVDDLIVAGSHGFDVWSPSGGAIEPTAHSHEIHRDGGTGFLAHRWHVEQVVCGFTS